MPTPDTDLSSSAAVTRVKVIGVGGGGVNTIERLMSGGSLGIEVAQNARFGAVNTDLRSLDGSAIEEKLIIGRTLTRGLGAGGEAMIGKKAAEGDLPAIETLVAGADLVVIIVALGGGTGSGAAPVLAEAASKKGAIVITFATLPFSWEGERRMKQALDSLQSLRKACEAVITLQNDALLQGDSSGVSANDAFDRANGWICAGLNALCSVLFKKGLINIDFATLRSALPVRGGRTLFSVGSATGERRHKQVIERLSDCPLLHTTDSVNTADTLVINIVGGPGLSLAQVKEVVMLVKAKFGGKENTVLGAVIDESFGETIEVCVFGSAGIARRMKASPTRKPNELRAIQQIDDPERLPAEGNSFAVGDATAFDSFDEEARNPAHALKPGQTRSRTQPEQTELTFNEAPDFFADAHSFVNGQDVDVPTFQRRGIPIRL